MFLWFKKFFSDWRLVKTISVPVEYNGKNAKIYYHLYESNRKLRRVKIDTTISYFPTYFNVDDAAKRIEIYQEKILRWLEGRYDPDIPTYSQVPEEDTSNALKGKIS